MKLSTQLKTFEDLDQERCWSYIINDEVKIGRYYRSPVRPDPHPGCKFHWKGNVLFLKDWSNGTNLTCVKAWSIKENLSYTQAIISLYRVTSLNVNYIPKSKPTLYSQNCLIDVVRRNWDKRDKEYWGKLCVKKDQLEDSRHLVIPVESYTVDYGNYKKTEYPKDLCYAYYYEDRKHQLYFPNRAKPRFKGNLGKNDCWETNRESDTILITKSSKDLIVLENILPQGWNLSKIQSENNCPDDWKILEWELRHKQHYILLDNDSAGVIGAKKLQERFQNITPIILDIPQETGCKDTAELMLKYGFDKTKEIINSLF